MAALTLRQQATAALRARRLLRVAAQARKVAAALMGTADTSNLSSEWISLKDFDKSKCSAPSFFLFSSKLSVCHRGHLPALTGYPSCTEGCDAAKIGPSGPCRINRRFARFCEAAHRQGGGRSDWRFQALKSVKKRTRLFKIKQDFLIRDNEKFW